jgi:hypothetical protein
MYKAIVRAMVFESLLFAAFRSATAQSPSGFSFTIPAANQCQSQWDKFYENEPGVYAFWALCEPGGSPSAYKAFDYVGPYDLPGNGYTGYAKGVSGGATGPVSDGETGASVADQGSALVNQGIVMNTRSGSLATWVNASASGTTALPTGYTTTVMTIQNIDGLHLSKVKLGAVRAGSSICYNGTFANSTGTYYTIQTSSCYSGSAWHRVVFTWNAGTLALFVDGAAATVTGSSTYTGSLDSFDFFYILFDEYSKSSPISMSMAKSLIANAAWTSTEVGTDYSPGAFATIPTGGVYVDWTTLGAIHKDVLGYADNGEDISTSAKINTLKTSLTKMGATSLRYANGYAGIGADEENWQSSATNPMNYCDYSSQGAGTPKTGVNIANANNIDNYLPNIAQPLNLDIGFTVNYGSNPPTCNAGGDPTANGSALVTYANVTHKYNIKYWEIGNEQFSGESELDLHRSNPNTGSSYVANEPAFYTGMKAAAAANPDSPIQIAIPAAISMADTAWAEKFTLPAMAGAQYDAVVYHNYPIHDPTTDGDTLYPDYVSSNLTRTLGQLKTMQTAMLNFGKSAGAIWVTEWDGDPSGAKWSRQTLGAAEPIFVVSQLAQYMMAGVPYATWLGVTPPSLCTEDFYDTAGETAYNWWDGCGSPSLIYTDEVGQGFPGDTVNVGFNLGDLMPAARGFQLLSESGFVREGERMLRTQPDVVNAPWLLTYAATHGVNYAVILINRDSNNSRNVPVYLKNRTSGQVDVYSYNRGTQYDPTQGTGPSGLGNWEVDPTVTTNVAWSGMYTPTLAPWSVTVLMFH